MGSITNTLRHAALATAAASASFAAAEAASAPGTVWLMDAQSKCYVLYGDSQPADSVTWTGACSNGGATGDGTATFMDRGRFAGQVSGKFVNGAATGAAHASWADGAHYDGNEDGSRFSGQGVLTTGSGDRFEGQWADGRMNGRGSVVWANGDRYDGDWRDNKAEGHGVQTWADGRKYDGAWKNDLPNGHGLLTRKDGSTFDGEFADGEPKPATVVASPSTPTASPAAPKLAAAVAGLSSPSSATADAPAGVAAGPAPASAGSPRWVDALVGLKLLAVDGSMLSLQPADGAVVREVTAPNGSVEATTFTFLNGKQGTVSDPRDVSKIVGVFRLSNASLDVDYADGGTERWSAVNGGVAMTRHDGGGASCTAWYPQGHTFSAAEKQAAVVAYAARLGLQTPRATPAVAKTCTEQASAATPTPAAAVTPVKTVAPASHESAASKHRHKRNAETAALDEPSTALAPMMMASVDSAMPIDVRASTVHTIDAPTSPPASNSGADAASGCLKVDTQGASWGFRNSCSFPVQFAWCVMGGSDERDACDGGAVPGAVSANSFDALFADSNLKAEHDLRWIACEGGSGDVVPRLVKADPPAGRCVRGRAS